MEVRTEGNWVSWVAYGTYPWRALLPYRYLKEEGTVQASEPVATRGKQGARRHHYYATVHRYHRHALHGMGAASFCHTLGSSPCHCLNSVQVDVRLRQQYFWRLVLY